MLAAALLLLSPHTPLLFMGQEYDEANPFQFFTDHGDPALKKAVSEGRRREFKDFDFSQVPDPQDPATFERSRLNWRLTRGENIMLAWYASLIELRKTYITTSSRTSRTELADGVIHMQVPAEDPVVKVFARIEGTAELPQPGLEWEKSLAEEADGYAIAVYVVSRA
jgi:maltooligosyltrehalose trehalohydrolase